MTQLGNIFAELGISEYLQYFIDQGFDTWDTILDITESDFDALGVKLGHRRKLQRKIAHSRGLSSDRALASPPRYTPSDERHSEDRKSGGSTIKEGGGNVQGAKRKYRRHPKPDENAPERPPSAYVIFSNKMREELKGRHLSFTEIAKLVGENWQSLSPAEKEPCEQPAFTAKEKYNGELAEYKKTSYFREYSHYLADFKSRQAALQQESDTAKRPKLVAHQSTASSGTGSSGTSQHGGDTPSNRVRVESAASNLNQWLPNDGVSSPQLSGLKNLAVTHGSSGQGSPNQSPTALSGYRESIFPGLPQSHQNFARREGQRDEISPASQQLPRMANRDESHRSIYSGGPIGDSVDQTGPMQQYAHRTGQSHPPPFLVSESTNLSSASSGSTSSSAFYTPRTPLEPALDRPPIQLPAIFPHKSSSGSFESQLQPLRPPSLSPQTIIHGLQQSPTGINPINDFPGPIAPMRGYTAAKPQQLPPVDGNDSRLRDLLFATSPDDNNLDPINALLKAGEIVDRSSRNRLPP